MQASCRVAHGAAAFGLQWHRTHAGVVCDQLRFSGDVVPTLIATGRSHDEDLLTHRKALFLLGLPHILLVGYCGWDRDPCPPSQGGQCVDPRSLLTDLHIGGCRSAACCGWGRNLCCISAPGCISP